MDIIKQRRRSSVRSLMTKEPIQNESFLGVVLKPVVKDAKDPNEPQQAKQLLKVTLLFKALCFTLFSPFSVLLSTLQMAVSSYFSYSLSLFSNNSLLSYSPLFPLSTKHRLLHLLLYIFLTTSTSIS